jgi:hypothetical protein
MPLAYRPFRLVSGNSDNLTSIKSVGGKVGFIIASNINAAIRYLHLYDKAIAPTIGTDTPVLTIPIPGSTTGGGAILNVENGIQFNNGIAIAITTTNQTIPLTGNTAAGEQVVSLGYV